MAARSFHTFCPVTSHPSAAALGPGGQPGQVRTRARLAEQLAPGDLAGHGRRTKRPPQLLGAVLDDRRRGQATPTPRPAGHPAPASSSATSAAGRRQRPAAPLARPGRARPARVGQQLPPLAPGSAPDPSWPRSMPHLGATSARRTAVVTGPRIGPAGVGRTRGCPRRSPPSGAAGPARPFPIHRRADPVGQVPHRLPDRPHRERGAEAISAASSCAAARRPSGSASRSASPIRAASSPPTRRPVYSSSSAAAGR